MRLQNLTFLSRLSIVLNGAAILVAGLALFTGWSSPPWYIGGSWTLIALVGAAGLVIDYLSYRRRT